MNDHQSLRAPDNVRAFADIGLSDIEDVGGKNASLGEMVSNLSSLGVRVPDGFATTADAFRRFIGDTGLAEPHQHPAVRTKLEDLVALSVLAEPVGDPDIAVAVHMQPMRKQEQSLAEGLHQRA